ncbi:putative leader peptide [Streptomyces sp. MS1.AVA.1]|uniref:Leader peptide n=1 Tax=Streptomyces machairae TaxID=3134109 RepID=A0ABU8UTC5_9ACTN
MTRCARRESARPGGTEVADVTHIFHAVHLHSRPHIDLQRVAGALCCS